MRLSRIFRVAPIFAALPLASIAADPVPEVVRDAVRPQAIEVVHTVRVIPEACVRIEGRFTTREEAPYVLRVVRSHPQCRARARLLDAAAVRPSLQSGWRLNDLIRIPSVACPSRQALVHVWRRPGNAEPPRLDAQGRSRIYLGELRGASMPHAQAAMTAYAVTLEVEGASCLP